MNRHYMRCTYCERPLAIESEREELQFILEQPCPLCGEKALRYMGRVQRKNLVKDITKSVCDARCTNAVGPIAIVLAVMLTTAQRNLLYSIK